MHCPLLNLPPLTSSAKNLVDQEIGMKQPSLSKIRTEEHFYMVALNSSKETDFRILVDRIISVKTWF